MNYVTYFKKCKTLFKKIVGIFDVDQVTKH